ncbi:hypothetical protein GPJ55_22980 [Bacillus subtilis]|nr:hypothetical protein GPJ55_22980 [Bacillus subtilis]
MGITRKAATSAVWSVEVSPEGIRIPTGSRFYIDNLYFQYQSDGTLKCETTGAVGNGNFAELPLLSLDNIPGLEAVIFEELKIPGQEEEDDEALYERYLMRARREAVSANKAHYKKWAEEVEGVGRAKVFPLWNGEGTVKVVITDGNFDVVSVRKYYREFESGMNSPHTEIYEHEMPGGQYSNLQQQAKGVGLGDRWNEVKEMYRRVNDMFGDIVKVTPSSKVVGDMALYMVQNDLTEEDVYEKGATLDFPDSVVELFKGYLGQPHGGFPEKLQKLILKGEEPLTVRPGEKLKLVDFEAIQQQFKESHDLTLTEQIEAPDAIRLLTNEDNSLYQIQMNNHRYHNVMLREFPFTGDLVFVRIFRGIDSLVPHGDTTLRSGDRVLVSGSREYVAGLRAQLE